eukprot:jgi/Bigna1/132847/aug1.19_g7555
MGGRSGAAEGVAGPCGRALQGSDFVLCPTQYQKLGKRGNSMPQGEAGLGDIPTFMGAKPTGEVPPKPEGVTGKGKIALGEVVAAAAEPPHGLLS